MNYLIDQNSKYQPLRYAYHPIKIPFNLDGSKVVNIPPPSHPKKKFHGTFLGTIKSYLWSMIYLLQEDWYVLRMHCFWKAPKEKLIWFGLLCLYCENYMRYIFIYRPVIQNIFVKHIFK